MPSISNFITTLIPHIKKPTVQKDLDATIKELSEYSIPMAKEMSNQYKLAPFKSTFYKVFVSHVNNHVKFEKKSDNIWFNISTALLNVQANAEKLRSMIDNYLQEDTLRDGITAKSANYLRMAGAMSFVSAYVTEVSDYILAQEAVVFGDTDETAPAQAKYLTDNAEKFARLLADTSIPTKDFEIIFSDIPDVYLQAKNQDAVAGMFTAKQLDPFNSLAGSGWIGSPVYTIRMMWETFQAERYHAAKDRKAMLELRLIHLQNRQHDESNPRIQREIEGLQARIQKYDQKIRRVEESLA